MDRVTLRIFLLVVLAVSVSLVASGVQAQYDEEEILPKAGDVLIGTSLGGGTGAGYLDLNGFKMTRIGLSLDYLLTDAFALGGDVSYAKLEGGGDSSDAVDWGIGLAYFLRPTSGNLLPYLGVKYTRMESLGDSSGFSIAGGFQSFLSPNVAIDFSISYLRLKNGAAADGFGISLGLAFWLRK